MSLSSRADARRSDGSSGRAVRGSGCAQGQRGCDRACTRRRWSGAVAGDADVFGHDARAVDAGRLAGELRGDAGGDGVDRRLLETRLLRAGGALRVLAVERAAPAQRAWAQDRRAGLGLDLSAARARAGAGELRATETDP